MKISLLKHTHRGRQFALLLTIITTAGFFASAQAADQAAQAPAQQQGGSIQNSIVKIFATHNHPSYTTPWQRKGIHAVTGSGAIIANHRILTNAHVVADQTLLEVQREGSGHTYTADVEYVCHSCDLAILTVDDEAFFANTTPLEIDGLPALQSRVNVYGFPTGGETISITEGIVSRIEVDYYVHSLDRYLLVQVDAAINPGNSGGPVISSGKIVGIAMQALENAENIGYIVPAPIVMHFLDDLKDGRFDGFPELDIYVQLLENTDLRRSLKIPGDADGLLITGVGEDSPVNKFLHPGDVLLEIEGYPIDRDGKVTLENNLRVESSHLEYRRQVGEKLKIKILRQQETLTLKIPMTARKQRINHKQYDRIPTYYVFAGFVFQPLSSDYLGANHQSQYNLVSYIPEYTLAGYRKQIPPRITNQRAQTIVLSTVLPHAINRGYKNMESSVIYSVNGTAVKDLKHMIRLIESASGPYLNITTDYGNIIALDLEKARKNNGKILQNYQVSIDRSPDLL